MTNMTVTNQETLTLPPPADAEAEPEVPPPEVPPEAAPEATDADTDPTAAHGHSQDADNAEEASAAKDSLGFKFMFSITV